MLFLKLSWNIQQELQTHLTAIAPSNMQNYFHTYFFDPLLLLRYCDFQMLLGDYGCTKNSKLKCKLVEVYVFHSSLSGLGLPFHLRNFS